MTHHRQVWSILAAIGCAALVSCDSRSPVEQTTKRQADVKSGLEQIAKLDVDVTFTLEDGEAWNRENPDSFWIPSKGRRENLVQGDLVKLVFNLTDGEQTQGERMWVIVRGGDRLGYTGTLDNDPYSTDQIKAGLEVSFEPRHVIDIFEDERPNNDEAEDGADQTVPAPATKPEQEPGRPFQAAPENISLQE